MSAATIPRRGVPYYDVARGKTMILPRKGGGAVEYVRDAPKPQFSARQALRRAGIRAAGTADQRAARARTSASRATRAALPTFRSSDTGWGGLIVYVFLSILGLALLENLLSGRGAAAASKALGFLAGGINRLVSPVDPIIGKGVLPAATSAPAEASAPSPGTVQPQTGSKLADAGGFLPGGVSFRLGRVDQGRDLQTKPGQAIVAPGAGFVLRVGSDPGGGGRHFGPSYPIVHFTSGPYAGQTVYIGHTVTRLEQGAKFVAGEILAVTGNGGPESGGAPPGWAEIGYAPGGTPGPFGQPAPF